MAGQKKGLRWSLAKLWEWVAGAGPEDRSRSLEKQAQGMLHGLSMRREETAFHMARAAAKRDELSREVANYEGLDTQGRALLRAGKRQEAETVVQERIRSEQRVAQLTVELEPLDLAAENAVVLYKDEGTRVESMVEQLPKLQQEDHLNQLAREREEAARAFDLESAERAFQGTRERIQLEGRIQRAKDLLSGAEAAKKRMAVREAMSDLQLQQAMKQLEAEVTAETGQVEAAFEVVEEESPVVQARKMLQAPPAGLRGILPARREEAEKVPAATS